GNTTTEKESNDKGVKKQKVLEYKNNDASAKNAIHTQKPTEENSTNQLPEKVNDAIIVSNDGINQKPNYEISPLNKIEPSKELAQNIDKNKTVKTESLVNAQNVSYVADEDNKNENYVFYDVTADKFRKTKVGGFLKKVKRVVERNNPITRHLSGDDRQVVSN